MIMDEDDKWQMKQKRITQFDRIQTQITVLSYLLYLSAIFAPFGIYVNAYLLLTGSIPNGVNLVAYLVLTIAMVAIVPTFISHRKKINDYKKIKTKFTSDD
jgi:hypothetical protein